MIERKTVFILGAGASVDYGFPTSDQLREKIVAPSLRRIYENSKQSNEAHKDSQTGVWNYIFNKHGKDNVFNFRESFSKSGKQSVDAFLEHRQEFLDIGKTMIAMNLIDRESENALFKAKNNWYEHIYGRLNTSFEDFDRNNVSFITFNYDRSLEHYLLTCIKNSYDKTDEEAAKVLKKIPIIHLYGSLGSLSTLGEDEESREYNTKITTNIIDMCINKIKIIHEDVDLDSDEEFQKAYELIRDARMICFLGFSYDENNLKRLRLRDILTLNHLVFGSAYGLMPAEANKIKAWFGSELANREMYIDQSGELDCLGYLRSIANFI